MLHSTLLRGSLAVVTAAVMTHAGDARACGGGMFYPESEQATVSVAGHQVVVSISKTRTVLWDRITFTGAPADFAWVMPVASGARLEIASAAWIEAIVGGTAPIVVSPEVYCDDGGGSEGSSGGCCGSAVDGALRGYGGGSANGDGERQDVIVVHAENIGPYETVTIKSDTPGAIGKWLTDNGYAIPAGVEPALDDYAAEGLEFIAAKLAPGKGVQDMRPVRVIMDGMLTTFPMRMLAAGARASVPITLAVISEGRYEAKGFANTVIDGSKVTWDFNLHASDYASVRKAALAGSGGETWLTSFAANGGLLSPLTIEDQLRAFSLGDGGSFDTLAGLYFQRAVAIGETTTTCSEQAIAGIATLPGEVVELCADTTLPCSKLQPGQIDAATIGCGPLDDLSTALVGMHPKSVWISRLEADLPVASLAQDLTLTPASSQAPQSRVVQAGGQEGSPCPGASASAIRVSPERRAAAPLGVLGFGLALAIARKRSKRPQRSGSR